VEIELREAPAGYIAPIQTFFEDHVNATGKTRRVNIVELGALETKQVRARRNHEVVREDRNGVYYAGGKVNLYVYCIGRHWWMRWRIPIVFPVDDIGPIRQ
jgi:hypothetical protein